MRQRPLRTLGAWLPVFALFALSPLRVSGAPPAASASSAPSTKPPTRAELVAEAKHKAKAQLYVTQGTKHLSEGEYLEALAKFQAAYAEYPSPKILINIGTTLRQLGRNVEAAEAYEQYLRDPKSDPARKKEVERIVGEIDAVVAKVRVTLVDVSPTSVIEMRLDGKAVEALSQGKWVRVEAGEHTVSAKKSDAAPVVQTFKVQVREEHEVKIRFAPQAPQKPAATWSRTAAYVAGGAGAVGVVLGVSFGIAAKVQDGEAANQCFGVTACTAVGAAAGDGARRSADVSTAMFVVGTTLLAGGVTLWLVGPKLESGPKQGPAPAEAWVRAVPGGISVGGAF